MTSFRRVRSLWFAAAAVTTVSVGACRKQAHEAPPVATPTVTLSRTQVPIGSPLDITYRFVVAPDAHFTQDYRVMVHVLDSDEEMMWTDDHDPPTPTREWKPGQTIEYSRTVFVPAYPYVGQATIQIGLYSTADRSRLPLAGPSSGQRAYTVAHMEIEPQTTNLAVVFKEGWHTVEVAPHDPAVEWQWTKKDAALEFRNPKKECLVYVDADNPGDVFDQPQQVQVSVGGAAVDRFTIPARQRVLRKIRLTSAQLGATDPVEMQIEVDKTFVPALVPGSSDKDPRELGIRVFHVYVEPSE
jgi:hypothetical protein